MLAVTLSLTVRIKSYSSHHYLGECVVLWQMIE